MRKCFGFVDFWRSPVVSARRIDDIRTHGKKTTGKSDRQIVVLNALLQDQKRRLTFFILVIIIPHYDY